MPNIHNTEVPEVAFVTLLKITTPFLGCSAAEIRRVYSNLPYINLGVAAFSKNEAIERNNL